MSWEKFGKDLERGREFEDYASERLWGLGLAVMMYWSRRYQDKGESLNGVEIKYEGVFRRTGRLYICLLYTSPSQRDETLSRKPECA